MPNRSVYFSLCNTWRHTTSTSIQLPAQVSIGELCIHFYLCRGCLLPRKVELGIISPQKAAVWSQISITYPYEKTSKEMCRQVCQVWGDFLENTVNTLRSRQNGRHFAHDIFKRIFLNGNVWISINISLRSVPGGPIDNIPALVQIMAWRWPGDKPLSEPMMVNLLTHICVTRPQWLNPHYNTIIIFQNIKKKPSVTFKSALYPTHVIVNHT